MPDKIDIGLRVRDYLDKKRYTQSEVAERLGVSRQTLHAALSKKDLKVKLLLGILKVTGGSLDEILGEFCMLTEDEDKMKEYMQQLIKVQKEQIEQLKKELKK